MRVSTGQYQGVVQLNALPTLYTFTTCTACRVLLNRLRLGNPIEHLNYRITTPQELQVMQNLLDVESMPVLVMPDKTVITCLNKIAKTLKVAL